MRPTVRRSVLARMLLTVVFILSFLPYVFGLTLQNLLIPIAALCSSAIVVPLICPQRHGAVGRSLTSGPFVWIAAIMPVLPLTWAVAHQDTQSVLYTVLMLAVLVSCRVILTAIGFRAVVRAFSVAGLVCVPLFLATSLGGLMYALHHAIRYRPAETQPNAVAYIFAGFTVVWLSTLWHHPRLSRKLLYGVAIAASSCVIFLASSRASMLAVTAAALCMVCISLMRLRPTSLVSVNGVSMSALAFFLAIVLLLVVSPTVLERYLGHFLQLHSQYRGFGSGLSGRLARWSITMAHISAGLHWLFGSGYDSSRTQLGFSIDNGYLTVLYEAGVLGLAIIAARLISLLRASFRGALRHPEFGVLLMVLVALVLNNVFDRYLFQMGNPFSLLALFVLLLDRRDLRSFERALREAKKVVSSRGDHVAPSSQALRPHWPVRAPIRVLESDAVESKTWTAVLPIPTHCHPVTMRLPDASTWLREAHEQAEIRKGRR